jgi:arylsulfatase A-like enzyme
VSSPRRPNILFILADDLGYADLSCYGSRHTQTPCLDELASAGVRLTQAYANSPVCSATRVALITGRYQYRLPVGLAEPVRSTDIDLGLLPGTPTLPARLQAAGYRTALIGKWHLGAPPHFGPQQSGYDRFFGFHFGGVDYFTHSHRAPGRPTSDFDGLYEGAEPVTREGYLTDILADEAIAELQRSVGSRPFFLSLHFNAPHWPWEGPGDRARSASLTSLRDEAGGSIETYAAMVAAMDGAVGRVLAALADLGLEDNTMVVFTSDNGGERFSDMWPFVGAKGELLEGGIRVPAVVRWPAGPAGGRICEQVAMSMDWAPTLLGAAGLASQSFAGAFDGIDLNPALAGEPATPRRLFWRYSAYDQRAVRDGDWKLLVIDGSSFLFDLSADVRERANQAQRYPERLAQLSQYFEAWDAAMLPYPAGLVSENPKGRWVDRY